jgi:ATP-dependent DNA ligase
VGEPEGDALIYRGHVGGGFTEALGQRVAGMLKPLEIPEPPFAKVPWEIRRKARWVRPEYIVMVRFTEITRDGVLRHPRFIRIRHLSEPGAGEHLRSRTIANRKPKRRRRAAPRRDAPKPNPQALTKALRGSLHARGRRSTS